jgi:hypothetical protein
VVQQDSLTRLLIEKGVFSKEEFLEMVKAVDGERSRKRISDSKSYITGGCK